MNINVLMSALINAFLAASFLILCFTASNKPIPIRLHANELTIFFILVALAFILINFSWYRNIALNEQVKVNPENMADYLNKKLFDKYFVVFSIKPTAAINLSGSRATNLYMVRNKSFAQFVVTYFDASLMPIIWLLLICIPWFFTDQQAPSYLSLMNRFWFSFAIICWLMTVTWFSCLSVLVLRFRCYFFVKNNLLKKGK